MNFISAVDKHSPDVLDQLKSVEPQGGGIMPSEALAFVCACLEQGVDTVVESGRKLGYSTEVLARCLPDCRIVSIESNPILESDARFTRYENLKLVHGDGNKSIPRHVSARTALLMDGPKGFNALKVIESVRDRIVFGAIHDLCQGNKCRVKMKRCGTEAWYTDDPDYVDGYGDLDEFWWRNGGYVSREEMTRESFCFGFLKGVLSQ